MRNGKVRTEHSGAKGSGAKHGFYGLRADAKRECDSLRRRRDREEVLDRLEDLAEPRFVDAILDDVERLVAEEDVVVFDERSDR